MCTASAVNHDTCSNGWAAGHNAVLPVRMLATRHLITLDTPHPAANCSLQFVNQFWGQSSSDWIFVNYVLLSAFVTWVGLREWALRGPPSGCISATAVPSDCHTSA